MDTSIISITVGVVSLGISIGLLVWNSKLKKRLDNLTSGLSEDNLEDIVQKYIIMLRNCEDDIEKMHQEFDVIRKETSKFFKKVGIVRFQAFKDTGGDQSFALAMLDEANNGFLISSLHGRGFAKIYAKEIIDGNSENYKLTDEEEKAIERAINS
jgi:hypothetical protein